MIALQKIAGTFARARLSGGHHVALPAHNADFALGVMTPITTQVGIVGAGPAGLMLGHLLHLAGIDSFIIENRPEDYVIERVRAGVLEQSTVDLMIENGVGDRLKREGMSHDGIYFNVFGKRHRIDFADLIGRRITVYGQNEVVKDLIAARRRSAGLSFSKYRMSACTISNPVSQTSALRKATSRTRSGATSLPRVTDFTASAGHRFLRAASTFTSAFTHLDGLAFLPTLLLHRLNSYTADTSTVLRSSACGRIR